MNQKMDVQDWSKIIEDQFAPIFLKLINEVQKSLGSFEYVEWLSKFKHNIAFKAVDSLIGYIYIKVQNAPRFLNIA